jgi:hypothetical protein
MKQSIVELIAGDLSADVVSLVEKTLAGKVLSAIQEQKREVALQAYGSLKEYFGGDDLPEFVDSDDNAYAVFFQNALKKFGVNGPNDFQDEQSKQKFFDYVDQNWKAQGLNAGAPSGGNFELGTQTQLPTPAAKPMAPVQPGAGVQQMPAKPMAKRKPMGAQPTDLENPDDASVAGMAPASPTINKQAPMTSDGDDPELDAQMGGNPNDPDGDGDDDSTPEGDTDHDFQSDPNDPNAGDDELSPDGGTDENGLPIEGGDDQNPNLEIGDDDQVDAQQSPDFSNEPEDEKGLGAVDQNGGGDDDLDSAFDDEDAYSVDHSDFLGGGDDDDDSDGGGGGGDEDQDGMSNGDQDEGGFGGGDDDSDGSDDDDDSDEDDSDDSDDDQSDDDSDDDGSDDSDDSDDDSDQDPDLEVGDDDSDEDSAPAPAKKKPFGEALKATSYSRKERKAAKTPMRQAGKKASRFHEAFNGMVADNAEDAQFVVEKLTAFDHMKHKLKGDQTLSPEKKKLKMASLSGAQKKMGYVQKQLDQIRAQRDGMLKNLAKQRSAIKADPNKDPEQKKVALKTLAQMAQTNRKHFKDQALKVKSIHVAA